jgi:hypothetical protein
MGSFGRRFTCRTGNPKGNRPGPKGLGRNPLQSFDARLRPGRRPRKSGGRQRCRPPFRVRPCCARMASASDAGLLRGRREDRAGRTAAAPLRRHLLSGAHEAGGLGIHSAQSRGIGGERLRSPDRCLRHGRVRGHGAKRKRGDRDRLPGRPLHRRVAVGGDDGRCSTLPEALPGLCASHQASADDFRILRARYASSAAGPSYGITIKDRCGRRSVDVYFGQPGAGPKVLDARGRVRTRR